MVNGIVRFSALLLLFIFGLNIAGAQSEPVQPDYQSVLLTPSALEQELTQRYIAQYSSTGGITWLNAIMERASLYLPFIRNEIAERNLPPELAYLPVIESGFLNTARSKSGATGMWQFMMNSISPFDIKVNDYVDERRDFIKSTKGALRKLEDNYKMLGDWELALAAYNCGLGAMNRVLQKTKIRNFWELCKKNEFRSETVHYIPKFLAISWILSQPERFGIDDWPQTVEWTAIPLERQISLDIIAVEADVDRELLHRLNAELLHGITPPDKNYRLKVPVERLSQINSVLEQKDIKLLHYHYHTVKYGDTLYAMSRYYGVSLNFIEQYNPGISSRVIKIGETVIIPAYTEKPPPPSAPARVYSFDGRHIVKKSETFWSLGIRYGIDPETLAKANNMELNQILPEGKTLKVPIMGE